MEEQKINEQTTASSQESGENNQGGEVNSATTSATEVLSTKNTTNIGLIVLSIVIVAGLLGGVFYYTNNKNFTDMNENNAITTADPTTVRALVNGEEITQETLNTRITEAAPVLAQQGLDITNPETRAQVESQILDDIINYTLLKQSSTEAGTVVEQDVIDAAYDGYITQAGGEEQLLTQLEQISLSPEEFKQRLEEQQVLDAYIAENVDMSGVTITDEEAQAFYDNAVAAAGANAPEGSVPAFADVKDQVTDQLKSQKEQTLVGAFIDSLRENATIEIK